MNTDSITDADIRQMSDLWHICYPRSFNEPGCGQYYSPKEPARQLMGITIKIQQALIGDSEKYEFIAASQLARFNTPTFWLSKDIATAIEKTVPPGDIEWYSMPFPFEAAVFMMPKGSLVHPTEGDIGFIAYVRLRAGEERPSKLIPGRTFGSTNGGMTFLALTMTGHHLLHWNLPLDAFGPTISIPDIDNLVHYYAEGDQPHQSGVYFKDQPTMTTEDNNLIAKVAHFVFGSILLMEAEPNLVTPARMLKRVAKNGKPREFWSPNIIGEHYKIRHEGVASQGGTHSSPRLHWVRGSYKQQPHGVGRSLRKLLWIKPHLRGV
jgi:hypothetical protein